MPRPGVTIVIPTYNRAAFLREAIQSALDQTWRDLEVVVADDASTDDTPEVVAGFRDSRIRYHRHATNIGPTPNWQFAISAADTEFVAPLADDDLFLPDHLATALEVLDRYPLAAYYTSPAEYFGSESGFYRPRAITDTGTPLLYFAPREAVRFLGIDTPGPLNSMVCRTQAFRSGLYWGKPDYLPQDLLILPQLMVQGGFVFGNRITTRYRMHEANVSKAHYRKVGILRYNCMVWYGIRWVTRFLLDKRICELADVERHGREASSFLHVVPLVLALGSFDSTPELRALARRVFEARRDMDASSSRFRLARRLGFWTIPVGERLSQQRAGWRP